MRELWPGFGSCPEKGPQPRGEVQPEWSVLSINGLLQRQSTIQVSLAGSRPNLAMPHRGEGDWHHHKAPPRLLMLVTAEQSVTKMIAFVGRCRLVTDENITRRPAQISPVFSSFDLVCLFSLKQFFSANRNSPRLAASPPCPGDTALP